MADGSIYKRCSCRNPDTGKRLGQSCPRLRRGNGAWSPTHGRWHYQLELPAHRDGRRRYLRRGGFTTRTDVDAECEKARELLAIPDPADSESRARVADLIETAAKNGGNLPGYDEVRRRIHGGLPLDGLPTLAEWLDQWLAAKKTLRPATMNSYSSHLRLYLKPHLGHLRLDRLRVSHVGDMFDAIDEHNELIREARASADPTLRARVHHQRVVGPASKQRIRATLRAALNAAIREQLITFNAASYVELPSGRRPKPLVWTTNRVEQWRATGHVPSTVMVWTPEQTGAFLDHITDHRLYALYHLIALRALRRGEACGLHWNEIDFDNQTLTVRWQLTLVAWKPLEGEPKSDAGDRVVALDTATTHALQAHRRHQAEQHLAAGPDWTDTGLVFTKEDGQPLHPADVSDLFKTLTADADLPPIRLHDLRHSAATLMLAAGADMKIVQETLGHSNYSFTADTYTSVLPEAAQTAAEDAANLVPRLRTASR